MKRVRGLAAAVAVLVSAGLGQARAADDGDLFDEAKFFKLEEEIITSASKYAQSIVDSPHAISVITQEDIQRSGVVDLYELLRFLPGVMVFEHGSTKPEVILRGNPQQFSPRMLVLMDGVPLYENLFAGIFWQILPIQLNAIERVEVIRGASSTLYGANAFSGVLNIITKKVDKDMRRVQVFGAGGTQQLAQTEVIWNQPLNDKARMRWAGFLRHDNGYGSNNGDGQFDRVFLGQGRFDFEYDFSDRTGFRTFFVGRGGEKDIPLPAVGNASDNVHWIISGFNVNHKLNDRHDVAFQASYQNERLNPRATSTSPFFSDRHQWNADVTYNARLTDWYTLLAGTNMRQEWVNSFVLIPGFNRLTLFSLFANNDFKLHDKVTLTLGGRYEFDSFTESQLSGRANLTYKPFENHAFRWSVARAVRTPSVLNDRLNIRGIPALPIFPAGSVQDLLGNSNLKSEWVLAGEFGYQGRFLDNRLKADFQFYYNSLKDFILTAFQGFDPTGTPPRATFGFANNPNGQVFGFETELSYQFFPWWKSTVNYAFTHQTGFGTGTFPAHLANFKNRFVFDNGFSTELLFNYTSKYALDSPSLGFVKTKDLFRLDAKVAKRFFKDKLEIGVVGTNLIQSPREESSPQFGQIFKVDRRVYGTVAIEF